MKREGHLWYLRSVFIDQVEVESWNVEMFDYRKYEILESWNPACRQAGLDCWNDGILE